MGSGVGSSDADVVEAAADAQGDGGGAMVAAGWCEVAQLGFKSVASAFAAGQAGAEGQVKVATAVEFVPSVKIRLVC